MNEATVKKAILDYLQYLENQKKVVFIRNNSFCGRVMRDDGRVSFIKNSKLGSPDIICCFRGKFVGLEVKGDKGVQTNEQKEFQKKLEQVGGEYHVVKSLDDVKKIIF